MLVRQHRHTWLLHTKGGEFYKGALEKELIEKKMLIITEKVEDYRGQRVHFTLVKEEGFALLSVEERLKF